MKIVLFFYAIFISLFSFSQIQDAVYSPTIKSVQLYQYGNQLSYPVIRLGSGEQLELHFDDLDINIKNYSYTFQLCNADWTPAILSHFDFIKGFSQVRIGTYRNSSIAFTRYTHYQAVLPDRNCVPSRSGNYILKVFINSDTAKLIFTKRMLVVEERSAVSAQVQQPFNGQYFRSHQKIQFKVNLNAGVDVMNPQQQVKVTILQNNRWDNALTGLKPTFYSRNTLEYNTENDAIFAAGKEWRWLDLRSFRLQSDRVASAKSTNTSTDIFVKTDIDRSGQRINFYRDANGMYSLEPSENINPLWQSDYATVHFTFAPSGNQPYPRKDIFMIGQLTGNDLSDDAKMTYNSEKGVYEKSLFLKQGYYDYMYVTVDQQSPKKIASFEGTEGNLWETVNDYMILVYYRSLGGRADELIGVTRLSSLVNR